MNLIALKRRVNSIMVILISVQPGMNKVKKAFRSQRHVKPIAKIDYNLSIPIMYPYTVPPAFTNIIVSVLYLIFDNYNVNTLDRA